MSTTYADIQKNKKTTVFVLMLFFVFVSFISWFVGSYIFEGNGVSIMGFALIVSGFSGFFSYYYSDKMVLAISGAREVTPQENIYIHRLVENLCIGAGLPKPKIYIIEDSAMNAFATGRDYNHSAVCFTTGIINSLDKFELEGVVAHELAHIQNYDIRLMSVVSIAVGGVTLIADWATRGFLYGSGGRKKSSDLDTIIFLVGLVLIIISPIVAVLIKLAISRNREYLADAFGADITRNPQGLADALKKLSQDKEVLEAANGATAHLYINAPITQTSGLGFLSNMFNTHPPIQERIKRLENMV